MGATQKWDLTKFCWEWKERKEIIKSGKDFLGKKPEDYLNECNDGKGVLPRWSPLESEEGDSEREKAENGWPMCKRFHWVLNSLSYKT